MPIRRDVLVLSCAALLCAGSPARAQGGGGGAGGGGAGAGGGAGGGPGGGMGGGMGGGPPGGGAPGGGPPGGGAPGAATGGRGPGDQAAQDRAAEAVAAGLAAPLSQVLAMVRRSVPGEVLDVSLNEGSGGVWLYRLTVLTRAGEYRDVTVDARRNAVLHVTVR